MDIDGVILAAGESTRAGAFKMALEIDGKTVIERCIEGMRTVCGRIIVVGGFAIERITKILGDYPHVEIVFNKDYKQGMFTSVKIGISDVHAQAFFLTPGDYPLIGGNVYRKMLEADDDIVIPTYNGRKGHPVLMRSHLIVQILAKPDSYNLRDFTRAKGYSTIAVDDEAILLDIDTIEDYERMKERFERK